MKLGDLDVARGRCGAHSSLPQLMLMLMQWENPRSSPRTLSHKAANKEILVLASNISPCDNGLPQGLKHRPEANRRPGGGHGVESSSQLALQVAQSRTGYRPTLPHSLCCPCSSGPQCVCGCQADPPAVAAPACAAGRLRRHSSQEIAGRY